MVEILTGRSSLLLALEGRHTFMRDFKYCTILSDCQGVNVKIKMKRSGMFNTQSIAYTTISSPDAAY